LVTPYDILTQSLKKAGVLGVGQIPLAEDINDAFLDLNDLLAQWQRKRWLIWHLVDYSVVSTGAQFYTVGPNEDIDVAVRPDRLESAFFRQTIQTQPNKIDYPLEIIEARETYNEIALKTLTSFASYIFYDSAWPVAKVYPWPVLQADIYELFITVKAPLTSFTNLNDEVNLPPAYVPCIKFNMERRLRNAYRLPMDPELNALARDALNVIRGANTQIPRLNMPTDILRPGVYNPYSDQIR